AGRMGPARLAEQTLNAAAQRERLLGRALFAARTMGGRDDSRPALRRADAVEESGLHSRGRALAGAGSRSERGSFQPARRGVVEDAARQGAGAACALSLALWGEVDLQQWNLGCGWRAGSGDGTEDQHIFSVSRIRDFSHAKPIPPGIFPLRLFPA